MALPDAEKLAIMRRFNETREARRHFLALALSARSKIANGDMEGLAGVLTALGIHPEIAARLATGDRSALGLLSAEQKCQATAVMKSVDFAEITFLQKGTLASKAVGRLMDGDSADGSCFMISKSLLLTAHHAVPDEDTAKARLVQFNFEVDLNGNPVEEPDQFALDPDLFFCTDCRPTLDFTVVALGTSQNRAAQRPGICPLPSGRDPHSIETFVNIIQHPDQETKQVVFRENRVVCIPDEYLYYMADTNGGSSGSPVFNDNWQVVGMHRYGASLGDLGLPNQCPYLDDVNQGVPATAIVKELTEERLPKLTGKKRKLLEEALSL